MNNQMTNMGMSSNNNMMESLKSNMMTMLMINNMSGQGNGNGSSSKPAGNKDMFSIIYMFIATSVVDFIFKNAPIAINFFMKRYTDKIDNIKRDLSNTTKDITDNKIKKKTASITVTINVNNPENVLGHALLDFITNCKNTTHVSYIRENFILNQKDVINIEDDIFARMTESASADGTGNTGSISTNNNTGAGSNTGGGIVQIIEVYSFIKTTDQLRNFLDNIKQKYSVNIKNKLGNKRYYFNMHPLSVPIDMNNHKDMSRLPPNFIFVMKHFQTNRKFSNLFGKDIEAIRNRVNFFCKNRKWYDEKGIPYTLGLLLSGAPGTGKTSTIKCLANETNRHICNINLNNDMSKTQLENLFFNENINVTNPGTGQNESYCIPLDQRIYVLEDVDCQSDIVMERANRITPKNICNNPTELPSSPSGLPSSPYGLPSNPIPEPSTAKQNEDKHKVDLSFLLNLLDGVLENPGRIVIMTSNFPDTLDSALIRPGRIDVIAKFSNCMNKTVIEMMEFFYDSPLSEEDKARINVLKEEIVTPAELSKIMFENFSNMEASIVHMEQLSLKEQNVSKQSLEQAEDSEGFAEPQAAQNLDSLSRIPYGNPTTNEVALHCSLCSPDQTHSVASLPSEGFVEPLEGFVEKRMEQAPHIKQNEKLSLSEGFTGTTRVETPMGSLSGGAVKPRSSVDVDERSSSKSMDDDQTPTTNDLSSSEEKGDIQPNTTLSKDYIDVDDNLLTQKIHADTLYVFRTVVIPTHMGDRKILSMNKGQQYYLYLLIEKVFKNDIYKQMVVGWKKRYDNLLKTKTYDSLENYQMKNIINVKASEYKTDIYCFFTMERMSSLGILDKLQKDYELNKFSDFSSNTLLNSSNLNSATFSAF